MHVYTGRVVIDGVDNFIDEQVVDLTICKPASFVSVQPSTSVYIPTHSYKVVH